MDVFVYLDKEKMSVSQIRSGICSLTTGLNIETKEKCNKRRQERAQTHTC